MAAVSRGKPDLADGSVAAKVSRIRNFIDFQFVATPSAYNARTAAEAEEMVIVCRFARLRNEVSAVAIGAEADQVSGATLGTFNAVAKAGRHGFAKSNDVINGLAQNSCGSAGRPFWQHVGNIDQRRAEGWTFADFDRKARSLRAAASENLLLGTCSGNMVRKRPYVRQGRNMMGSSHDPRLASLFASTVVARSAV
jgi:hypothetical protein